MSKKIAVLASGSGSNLQAIIDSVREEKLEAEISLVIANKIDAYALERAKKNNIKSYFIKDEDEMIKILNQHNIDLIVLAGFLKILSEEFIQQFQGKILNIHPSLIPSFCGKGYYGLKVHQKALEYGVKVSGATVHFVTKDPDSGPIIMQKAVYIDEDETAESLQKKVLKVEHEILVESIKKVLKDGGKK